MPRRRQTRTTEPARQPSRSRATPSRRRRAAPAAARIIWSTLDLSGAWRTEDGSLYFMQHSADGSLVWAGLHDSGYHKGISFSNVFRGRVDLERKTVTGDWADVPRGIGPLKHGRLTLDIVQPPPAPNGDHEPPPHAPGGVGRPPQPRIELVKTSPNSRYPGTRWRGAWPTNLSYPQDTFDLFDRVRRSGPRPIGAEIRPQKDFAVIQGFIGARGYSYGWYPDQPHDYCYFVFPWREGPDGDINFDLELDAADRQRLDDQPGFWSSGWLTEQIGVFSTPATIRLMLYERLAFHCELVMFGREETWPTCEPSYGGLLPGWAELEGNSVLINGWPVNGNAGRDGFVLGLDPQPGGNLYFNLHSPEVPGGTFRLELEPASRLRVTGVIALDQGHTFQPTGLEIHPVYAIDVLQDFQDRRRNPNADLTGVWQADDVGTYYLHQVGQDKLWWLGLSHDQGRTFANVFRGTIDRDTIQGDWTDVPIGVEGAHSSGRLSLHADEFDQSPTTLTAVTRTGGFAGSTWQKMYDRPFATPPPFGRSTDPSR